MKTGRKIPAIDFSKCRICMRCLQVCPHKAIIERLDSPCSRCIKYCVSFDVPCVPAAFVINHELCDSCGLCIKECPEGAISWIDEETG